MPRVKPLSPSDVPPPARVVYERVLRDYGPFESMLQVFAHRPPAVELLWGYLLQSRADALISRRHLEIALLAASRAHACEYCVAHHEPRLIEEGISQETVDRILDPDVPGLNGLDRLVRDYAVQVTRDAARVSNDMFTALRRHYSEVQVVELTIRIALCSFFKRFNEALRVDAEDAVGLEFPASGEARPAA